MKKTLVFLFTLFICIGVHAQTVTTKDRCYFLSDEQGLANLYKVTLDEAKIGTIPKGKTLTILGYDTIQGNLIKVQYKNKIGWIHRTVVKDQYVINYQLKLVEVSLNGMEQALHPTEDMYFEDSNIAIKWGKGIDKLILVLHNKSPRSLSINWNNSSWVGINSMAEKFMHSGVKYVERNSEHANTIIPPNSRIDEIILPNSSVYYDDYLGWREKPLLLFTAKYEVEANNYSRLYSGQNVRVLLFLEQGESKYEYNFVFRLDHPIVKEINSKKTHNAEESKKESHGLLGDRKYKKKKALTDDVYK